MRPRYILWLSAAVLLLAASHAVWWWPGYRGAAWVKPGMSRTVVYRLLGGSGWQPDCGVGVPPGENPEFWHSPLGNVRIEFDDDGHVIRVQH